MYKNLVAECGFDNEWKLHCRALKFPNFQGVHNPRPPVEEGE